MDEDRPAQPASISAERVRGHRARRRAAGLVEVKVWVREQDVPQAHAALRLFTSEADQGLGRHQRQGQTNMVAVFRRGKGTLLGDHEEVWGTHAAAA